MTEEDIPWLHQLCRTAYPAGYYDPAASEVWIRKLMTSSSVLLLRGEYAWLNVSLAALPWQPSSTEVRFLPIASTGRGAWELVAMTEQAIAWARAKGAKRFHFAALTGVDLGPLARRFGAVPTSPAYVLDL